MEYDMHKVKKLFMENSEKLGDYKRILKHTPMVKKSDVLFEIDNDDTDYGY